MKTVLVMPKPGRMDHREACEITSEIIPAHIDFATINLEAFLERTVLKQP
jgi:putative hydrolase of the HAD superfamily